MKYNIQNIQFLVRKTLSELLKLAKRFEREGAKTIIVRGANDPGLKKLEKIKVFVIGAGLAAASLHQTSGIKSEF